MDLAQELSNLLVGQSEAIEAIADFHTLHEANLAPDGRPAGIFLLLGPTGVGKTETVEALAEVLHKHRGNVLKINCAEYQHSHEIAKLIGAPPGYLGHRETPPFLSQAKVNAVASDQCPISIILFDEIEKAHDSLFRILLGVLDKGELKLGDNSVVNLRDSYIFMTSNLGTAEINKIMDDKYAFNYMVEKKQTKKVSESTTISAVKRKFSPEFVNRIDRIITYQRLDRDCYYFILGRLIGKFQDLVDTRKGLKRFRVEITPAAQKKIVNEGTSEEYGARELKRVVHRSFIRPIATMVCNGEIPALSVVTLGISGGKYSITISEREAA